MKNFFYFLLFFISQPILAQSPSQVKIDIGVDGERIKLNCSEESTNEELNGLHYDFFLCERKGKTYLVRKIHEYNNYSGFEFDLSKKNFSPIEINEISKGD